MKTKKHKSINNHGFSLIELIVVVLIIAIISVAMTPQVVKWIGISKESVDANNRAAIKSAVSVAVLDFLSDGYEVKTEGEYWIGGTTPFEAKVHATSQASGAGVTLDNYIIEVMHGDYPAPQGGAPHFIVTIGINGTVTVTN